MKFKDFYKLLTESPLNIGNIDHRKYKETSAIIDATTDKIHNNKNYIKIYNFILDNKQIDVYEKIRNNANTEYVFSNNKNVIAVYQGVAYENGISTSYQEAQNGFLNKKSLMAEIYIRFLLKKYKFIRSGKMLTELGFSFWFKNFDYFLKMGYNISVIISDKNNRLISTEKTIKTKEELKNYYGDNEENGYFRYKISSTS